MESLQLRRLLRHLLQPITASSAFLQPQPAPSKSNKLRTQSVSLFAASFHPGEVVAELPRSPESRFKPTRAILSTKRARSDLNSFSYLSGQQLHQSRTGSIGTGPHTAATGGERARTVGTTGDGSAQRPHTLTCWVDETHKSAITFSAPNRPKDAVAAPRHPIPLPTRSAETANTHQTPHLPFKIFRQSGVLQWRSDGGEEWLRFICSNHQTCCGMIAGIQGCMDKDDR